MLQKQPIDISFAKGLDTKTDPKRVSIGSFLELENSIFTVDGLLQKRYGNRQLASLPDNSSSFVTTYRENLTAIGTSIAAYSTSNNNWVSKGSIQPLNLSTLPLLRNNLNQTACDSKISSNGLICTAYLEFNGSTTTNKYVIADAETGQNIVAPAVIPVSTGTVSGGMRVFILGNNFIIVFTNTISGTPHLQYITISITTPTSVGANTDIANAYVTATTLSWDAFVVNNSLYVTYNTTSGGQSIKVAALTSGLALITPVTLSGYKATLMSVTGDSTDAANPTIYVSFYDSVASKGYTAVFDKNLNTIMNPALIIASGTILNMTSSAQNGACKIFYEVQNFYSFSGSTPTNYINAVTVTPLTIMSRSVFLAAAPTITVSNATGLVNGMVVVDNTTPTNITAGTTFTIAGSVLTLSQVTAGASAGSPGDALGFATVSSAVTIIRSVGLASKSFIIDGVIYFLSVYVDPYQSTYFLINGSESTQASPVITAKLAYENAGGYLTTGLPGVSLDGSTVHIPYLFKFLIQSVNKNTNVPAGSQVNGIYSQLGINLARIEIGTDLFDTAEIGANLNFSGGFLWMYDGYLPVEQNFFLYPWVDQTTPTNTASWSATGGSIHAQPDGATNTNAYFYQFTYEWTDNAGNAFRSAPSIPTPVTTTGNGTAGSITLHIPTLRLTYKVSSPVKIVVYRWSVAQPIYYQVTSITAPTLNSTTTDSVTYIDTLADATILGNNIIYVNGGVVENTNGPASNIFTLFDNRLWQVDAEDQNLLWYSKEVIEDTPVEMSSLFTRFISPTTGAQGSTGPITALSVLDDKLIIFKQNAIYYINGAGPDSTGANNQYSQPIFVTSTVGCANQQSIVFIPDGLMFQSDKGIWLLDRGINTLYIGAEVQRFNSDLVKSAQNIPGTNQVRFIMNSGTVLMYDYYEKQWGTFTGVPGISSCIFEGLHTFINSFGEVYQEDSSTYLDGSRPVLMSFKTGPIRLVDLLQGYQRAYFFYLLGTYITPHKLLVNIYYDYSEDSSQSIIVLPDNFSPAYGAGSSSTPYGQQLVYGGPSTLEEAQLFFEQQRCQAISISLQEVYDGTYQVPAGAGFTLSGLNVVCGFKKGFKPTAVGKQFG